MIMTYPHFPQISSAKSMDITAPLVLSHWLSILLGSHTKHSQWFRMFQLQDPSTFHGKTCNSKHVQIYKSWFPVTDFPIQPIHINPARSMLYFRYIIPHHSPCPLLVPLGSGNQVAGSHRSPWLETCPGVGCCTATRSGRWSPVVDV